MTDKPPKDSQFPAWVQLYMARRQPPPPARTRPRGRPRRAVPREKKTAFRLTEAEWKEISLWKDHFSRLLGRQVSNGEAAGLLARICSERLRNIKADPPPQTLGELVDGMVGEGRN